MDNKILEFVDILTVGAKPHYRSRFELKGKLYRTDIIPPLSWNGGGGMSSLIELDNEDIEYFKNKYIPKLQKELNDKIDKLKQQYSDRIASK